MQCDKCRHYVRYTPASRDEPEIPSECNEANEIMMHEEVDLEQVSIMFQDILFTFASEGNCPRFQAHPQIKRYNHVFGRSKYVRNNEG